MLQKIREGTSGLSSKLFAVLIAAIFIFGFGGLGYKSYISNDVAVDVDGDKIYRSQVYHIARMMVLQSGQSEDILKKKDNIFYQRALNSLLYKKVINKISKMLNLAVSRDKVNESIVTSPAFIEDGKFSRQKYLEILKRSNHTDVSYRKDIEDNMISEQLYKGIAGSSFVTEKELELIVSSHEQKRDIIYALVDKNKFKAEANISPEKVKSYYDEHPEEFISPEKISLEYVTLSVKDLMGEVSVSEEEINASFVEYNKLHDDDNEKKVTDKEKTEYSIKEELKAELLYEKAEQLWSERSEELANLTYDNPGSLDIASSIGLTLSTTEMFTREGGSTNISSKDNIIDAAFSEHLLVERNNSELINLDNDTVIVFRVKNHAKERAADLFEVDGKITAILTKEHASDSARDFAMKIKDSYQSGKDLEALEEEFSLSFKKKEGLSKHADDLDPILVKAGFSLNRDESRSPIGVAQLSNGNYVVVFLDKVVDGNINTLSEEKLKAYRSGIEYARGNMEYQLLVDAMKSKIKIKVT